VPDVSVLVLLSIVLILYVSEAAEGKYI